MTSTQERIKQRRQYLKKKEATYAEMSLAALLLIPLIVIDFILVIFDVNALMMSFSPTYTSDRPSQFETLVLVALSLLLGWTTWRVVRTARQARQAAKQLPYVPPVTADSLPAEEVLVRGSEEPAQEQGKVLLRGTESSGSTGEQELLRGSQDERLRTI